MGMFDSFIVEFKDNTYELQSKCFSKDLSSYRIGDVVDGAYNGTHTYIDELYLDSKQKQTYSDKYSSKPSLLAINSIIFFLFSFKSNSILLKRQFPILSLITWGGGP